jgi:hypothetical protein
MEDILLSPEAGPPLPIAILLDDVTVASEDVGQNVRDAAEAIVRLCKAGAMVGLYKGVIGARECEFMGETWRTGGFWRPIEGRVEAVLKLGEEAWAAMPRAHLYGMLSYWRAFIPDFSSKTARLRSLLRQDAGDWTPEHTEEVRAVL